MVKIEEKLLHYTTKLALIYSMGFISYKYTYLDLINFKRSVKYLPLVVSLFATEEVINSYIPNWFESEKKAKFTRAEKISLANPVTINPSSKALVPAQHLNPGQTLSPANIFKGKKATSLVPAHHEL